MPVNPGWRHELPIYVRAMIHSVSPRRFAAPLALLTLASCLTACSGAAVLDALTPSDGYQVQHDLAYGPEPRQRLDLYAPEGAPADAPLVVFFYGGNWESGDKATYRFVGQAFTARGYVTAIPDYRLFPQVRYPLFLEDAAAAVAWLHVQQPARPIYLAGHSAGAYLAVMLSLDPRWLGAHDQAPCQLIAATVGLAGPYDFLPLHDATLEQIFGPGPASPGSQPINHVTPAAPPLLLATGEDDHTVYPRNSERLAAALLAVGSPAELRRYPGVTHVGLVAALAAPLRFVAPVLDDADAFLRHLPTVTDGRCPTADQTARAADAGRKPLTSSQASRSASLAASIR